MTLNCFEESLIKKSKLPFEWQSQETQDDLLTFLQSNWEQRSAFFNDENISTKQQFLDFKSGQNIRTNNYVGTIVFNGHQINIFPKVFKLDKDDYDTSDLDIKHLMLNLVNWIEYCSRIDYPYLNIKTASSDCSNLKELFISLFVKFLKSAFERSLYHQYIEKEEDLSSIKGKVNIVDYYTKKYPNGILDKFLCEFSEFEFDNLLNRIIKRTCKLIINDASIENQKELRKILGKLNEVGDFPCSAQDCEKVRLGKMHSHYRIVLSMCKMFLLNKTTTFDIDTNESFCFLFPTEVLFEGFIGGFMKNYLDGSKVRLQESEESLIEDVVYAGESFGKAFTMRHDILVEHKENGLFILDTKYKEIRRFQGSEDIKKQLNDDIKQSDLYQVSAYAVSRGLNKVYLLYPLYRYEDVEPHMPFMKKKIKVEGKESYIDIYAVRLPFVFETNVQKTKLELAKVIDSIFI